jgi:transitional endoplasmic reticulum ATPase
MATKQKDVEIVREGTQIVLPPKMTYQEGRDWLTRKEQEEEQAVSIHESIDAYPLDGARALAKAINEKYGFSAARGTLVGVPVSPTETEQVTWGEFQIPGIAGTFNTDLRQKDGRWTFILKGRIKQKHKAEVSELVKLVKGVLKTDSIYRGKAIRMQFSDEEDFSPEDGPKFMDLGSVNAAELVFPESTQKLIQDALYTPIERTQACRDAKIPLKRGVLFEGPYGTGKTLCANVTAKKCVENGWTFVYVDSVKNLQKAIYFAQSYQPAVIFAEDVDRATEGERRTDELDAILNTLDGVDTKSSELMVVLTTNHVEKINRAMLRPGRLDAVISVKPPDAKAAARLLRLYGRDMLALNEDLSTVAGMLDGQIPAVIREVVERAKLSAIGREVLEGGDIELNEPDLIAAASGMLDQVKLVAPLKNGHSNKVQLHISGMVAPNEDVELRS